MKTQPDISVVVCHHVGDLLYGFLTSLSKCTNTSFEVIVMTSDEKLSLEGIKGCLVFHHTGLPAAKRNSGARVARGKYLAFFDDDVEIDELCLYHLQDGIKGDVAMTYGRLWNMERRNRFDEAGGYLTWTGFIWSRAGQNDIDNGQYSKDELIFAGKSASCMIRRDVFKKVGGFDEDFGILGEESDLSWRVWLSGNQVLYTPQATGYHAFNTKFKPKEKYYTNDRVFYNGSRNYITMLIKNLGKEHLWVVPIHVAIWFTVAIVMICTMKVKEGFGILRGLGYIIQNLGGLLKKRAYVQEGRVALESNIWKKISRSAPRGYYLQRFWRYATQLLHG